MNELLKTSSPNHAVPTLVLKWEKKKGVACVKLSWCGDEYVRPLKAKTTLLKSETAH